MIVNLFLDFFGKLARFGSVERQAQREEQVLQAHHAESHRTPAPIGGPGGGDRIEIDVDHAIQERDRHAHGVARNFPKSNAPSVTCLARLIEPRLQTAVSCLEVTSVISVQRFERWTTLVACGGLV